MAVQDFLKAILLNCFIVVALSQEKPVIKTLHINSNIKYTFANTSVFSTILNPAEKSQEVTFRVVLPEEAFITGLTLTVQGKSYVAKIEGKEEAKKEYDAAVSAGQSAAHVFQDPRNSKEFTVNVNVEATEKINFNLTYEELLSRKNRIYTNEINVNPNQIVPDLKITVDIEDALDIVNVKVPNFKMSNEIELDEGENNEAKITKIAPNKVKIEWNPSTEDQTQLNKDGLNGQMVVKFDVDSSKNPQQILVDQDGYFVHILRNDDLPVLDKHVVFVLDLSGSMSGSKINQLKDAMKKILGDLRESDYFTILLFSGDVVAWDPSGENNLETLNSWREIERADVPANAGYINPANKDNVKKAIDFIGSLRTFGSTNINGGLRNGLKLARKGRSMQKEANNPSPPESMIIFLTDGQPNIEESDPLKITENVKQNNDGITIFSLAFGSDADLNFLKKLSLANGGFSRRIYAESDASLQLQGFYKLVASPVLANIKFEYLPDQVETSTNSDFKNLFSGSDNLVLGKLKAGGKVSGSLSANTRNGTQRFDIPISSIIILPPQPKEQNFGYLEKMWAFKTIKDLLDQNTVSKNETIEKKAKDLALKYSFVTPLTSLIVVKPNSSEVSTEDRPAESHRGGAYAFASPPRFPSPALMASGGGFGAPPNFGAPAGFGGGAAPTHHLTTYDAVSWLNKTISADGLYLSPPDDISTSDLIALNGTDSATNRCSDGSPCKHFVNCVLQEFSDDVQKFLPFKCHIDPKFLGVCCPHDAV